MTRHAMKDAMHRLSRTGGSSYQQVVIRAKLHHGLPETSSQEPGSGMIFHLNLALSSNGFKRTIIGLLVGITMPTKNAGTVLQSAACPR